jgi:hypothetical protein
MQSATTYAPDVIKMPHLIYKEQGTKNLLQKQTESDNKAFPVILGELKRTLQNEASEKEVDNTVHGLIKIILTLHLERRKLVKENPYMDKKMLFSINSVTEEEICRFMKDYRNAGNKVHLNNLDLIKLAITTILDKRKQHLERQKTKTVAKHTLQISIFN